VLAALIVVPLMIGGAVFATNAGAAAGVQGSSSSTFRHVTVHEGDSLWSIAQRVAPHVDPRDAIVEIADLNGLSSSVVQAGEQLAIPHQYDRSGR
jgi:LysM repeat protein